jgi:transposase
MSKASLVITALFVDHQTPAEVAAGYGVHRAWVYKLKARYEAEGETALEPRSRRPKTSPSALSPEVVDLIVRVRKELTDAGLDAGPETIGWHLEHHHGHQVSRSTISRHLTRSGLVIPEPKKRPKSSYIRFEASLPNETWQSDFTLYRLTCPDGRPGAEVEIISWLDDCTRYALHVSAYSRITTPIVVKTFRTALAQHGIPASTLTDIQRHGLHRPLRRRTRRPQQLRRRATTPPRRPEELPTRPPHHLRQGRAAPADPEEMAPRPARPADHDRRTPGAPRPLRRPIQLPAPAPVAAPPGDPGHALQLDAQGPAGDTSRDPETHDRIRHDIVDKAGSVTLRHNGRLHHIGIGRTHAGTCVIMIIQDLQIRVVDAATGELLRELILDPSRDYQPTGAPKGPTRKPPK